LPSRRSAAEGNAPETPRDLIDHRLKGEETMTFQPHLSMNDFAGLTGADAVPGSSGVTVDLEKCSSLWVPK
jgi:hypothetical protein